MIFDRRLTLARMDLASDGLEGQVRAARFAEPKRMRLIVPVAAIRSEPRFDAEQVDQLLFGESFDALDAADGFAWGQASRDGYVGWVEAATLSARAVEPTHRVTALRTYAFAEPSIKSAARGPFSVNALLRVEETEGALCFATGAGWIPVRHLAEIGTNFELAADVAERFAGSPYLWGGRDSLGIDCSGLVQQALYAAGKACPRDSDQQALLGAAIDREDLARGDLVFWRGHVGMMLDATRLIHANAHHMAVAVEPLDVAVNRIAKNGGGDPIAQRRLPF